MKKTRLLTLVMAIVMIAMSPMKVWAISGSGTSSDPYQIGSATDWANLTFHQKLLFSSSDSPVYIKLTADITLTSVTLRDNDVYIVLDGQGHTISLTGVTTSEENTGLFGKIGGGEVKNLHLGGNLTTSKKYMGNLCGKVTGKLTITNVLCSASLANTTEGDATAGGFIGQIEGNVTFNQCGYTYKFYGKGKSNQICGMVGYRSKGTVVFNNCFCKAVWDNVPSGDNYAYMRNDGSSTTYNNCYYVTYGTGGKATDKSSGGPTQIDASKFGTGELAYKLNGSSNGVARWYQNLSGTKDGYPFPYTTTASTHAKVYYGYDHGATSQTYNNSIYTQSAKHEFYNTYTTKWSNTDDPAKCSVKISYSCTVCDKVDSETLTPTYTTTDPTCAKAGKYAYTATSTKHKRDANNYITVQYNHEISTYKHGSNGYTAKYDWSGTADAPVCKFTLTCQECSSIVVNAQSITPEQSGEIKPTCTTKGSISYKAKGTLAETYNYKSFTDTKYTSHTYSVPALGHDYTYSWKWADDGSNATFTGTCSHDASHNIILDKTTDPAVSITSSITKEATATEEGEHTYKASVIYNGTTYNAPDKVIAIPKHVHEFAATDLTRDVCTTCGHGIFRYTSKDNAVVSPYAENNLTDADGNPLTIISNVYDAAAGKCVMEFNKPLVGIGKQAFYKCYGLTGDLVIPNSVTSIGESAFDDCYKLTGDLVIPNSVTSIGGFAFRDCGGFNGNLVIGNSVTSIGASAFYNCTGFTGNLTIPNSVTIIGTSAFEGCKGLKGNLTIGNSVRSIGALAFYNCTGFTGNLTIPNSVTTIGEWAFRDCAGFTGDLVIPNSVTIIGRDAFYKCTGFNGNLTIGNSVKSIEAYAFYKCSGFKGNLTIPNSVTEIGAYAFEDCTGFNGSLTIGNSVEYIWVKAFLNCSGFTSVEMRSYPRFGNFVFYGLDCDKSLVLTDNSYVYTDSEETCIPTLSTAPTYTRTMPATSKWGTVVLPFEIKSDNNVQLYELTGVSGGSLNLTPVATVAANTPCIFKKKVANATSVTITASGVDLSNAVPAEPGAVDGLSIRGTYTAADVAAGDGYVLDANKFVKTTAKTTLSPFRAYLAGSIDGVSTLHLPVVITSGDLNADGNITIADLALLVEILNSNGTITNSAADMDGDGSITLDDVNALRDKILEAK